MALSTEKKGDVLAKFRRSPKDTGSAEVQVALLSERINGLGEHFNAHKADHSSRRGLVRMVNQRRKLLDYLKATKPASYQQVTLLNTIVHTRLTALGLTVLNFVSLASSCFFFSTRRCSRSAVGT